MNFDPMFEDLKLLPGIQETFMDLMPDVEASGFYQFYLGLLLKSPPPDAVKFAAVQIAVMFYLAGFYQTSSASSNSNKTEEK